MLQKVLRVLHLLYDPNDVDTEMLLMLYQTSLVKSVGLAHLSSSREYP
jgi:hypothetical protein